MSSAQITPRKRKATTGTAEGLLTPQSTGRPKQKARGPPTPNPPLAPFPTPPPSRNRARPQRGEPLDQFATDDLPESSSKAALKASPLPPHLQTLLALHRAFNLALSLQIATRPPVLPPHKASTTQIEIRDLTNFLAIKETVERSSGRRFGSQELARLAWVWNWDGVHLPGEGVLGKEKEKAKVEEEGNPFLVTETNSPPEKVSGLSYLITTTRTLDASRKKVYTHGIGIELDLKPGETRQILPGGGAGGLGNKGQGGGMGAIGRWNTSGDLREEEFRRRLDRWVELNGGYEPPIQTDYPTPSTSSSSRSSIPPIPLLPLPKLPSSSLLSSANIFPSPSAASSSSLTQAMGGPGLSTPPRKVPSTAGLSDPFELVEKDKKVVRPGSVEERRQAMFDRIKARNGPKAPVTTLGSAISSGKITLSAAAQQEELKRRSTLSRLESVAEGVWMLFSAPSPGPNSLPTPPTGRRKVIPMAEAAEVIVKSSKTPISLAEAQTSLTMLTDLCPFFLKIKTVGRHDWLEMPSAVAAIPSSPQKLPLSSPASSPSTVTAAAATASDDGPFVPTHKPPASPSSPSRIGRPPLSAPGSPSPSPRSGGGGRLTAMTLALGGPASPSRVRRVGGLREVRERIRRELGE